MTVRQFADPVDVHTLPLVPVLWPTQGDGAIYSNFDHDYHAPTIDLVRSGRVYAQHSAWDFCGRVWFADGIWCETVYVFGTPVATYCAPELADLIAHVIDKHGSD